VLPPFRSQGLGRALMDAAARWAAATAPGRPLHLWVFAANHPALDFYKRLGAEAVERRIKGPAAGLAIESIRYLWRDLDALIRRLAPR
jgi:GNAT superfamily N-acetyltransferase